MPPATCASQNIAGTGIRWSQCHLTSKRAAAPPQCWQSVGERHTRHEPGHVFDRPGDCASPSAVRDRDSRPRSCLQTFGLSWWDCITRSGPCQRPQIATCARIARDIASKRLQRETVGGSPAHRSHRAGGDQLRPPAGGRPARPPGSFVRWAGPHRRADHAITSLRRISYRIYNVETSVAPDCGAVNLWRSELYG